jgi:N-alpha-acetyltransferase 30
MQASDVKYVDYINEKQLPLIMTLVSKDLSEPYSIFTYRYFLHKWPALCVCAYADNEQGDSEMVGTIVCKAEEEQGDIKGYIAMLTVNDKFRKMGIGSKLATMGIERMIAAGCVEIVLETEVTAIH